MIIYVISACISLLIGTADDRFEFRDKVYVDNVGTVQFHVTGLQTSYPIMQLGSVEALSLSFDDLDADSKYYRYTIVHCDKQWQPSKLDFNEYVYGFEGEEIDAFDRSVNTLVPFTHYSLLLPNDDFEITKSGNYLLIVYLNDPSEPVITRRFMVVDSKILIHATVPRPAEVSKLNTHQEIDFEIGAEQLRVHDPKNDIYVTVLQNGRWDNAITGLRSRFERNNVLVFDYQDKIVFPAGLDFRNIDMRSTQFRSRDIFEIRRENNRSRIIAEIDEPRTYQRFLSDIDINGKFVVRSTDDQRYTSITKIDENSVGDLVREVSIVDMTQHSLESDYVDVLFTLQSNEEYDSDVFLFGAFTDWTLQEPYRMTYDPVYKSYFADVPLKQGFYDYIYVLANSDGTADETTLEGNWYEATNNYTILVYHTSFGSRYDELVGAVTIPSHR